jgi:hypothetical protein
MIDEIPIEVTGDCWNNPDYVKNKLDQVSNNATVRLDFFNEGPSLSALGITRLVDQWLVDRKKSPALVQIHRWHNAAEFVPYTKIVCNKQSHFFNMARNYWIEDLAVIPVARSKKHFGFFVGRSTISRNTILFQCSKYWSAHFLISKMSTRTSEPWDVDYSNFVNLEKIDNWCNPNELAEMIEWFQHFAPTSIDGAHVGDQYITLDSYIDIHRSLLKFYNHFDIELVCETYTIGDTFFPTEKTARPLMAAKPCIVYGPRYYLARLRNMKFKTYHDLWDESYDLLEGPARWLAMKKVIDSICKLNTTDYQNLISQATEIAMHNRIILDKISKSKLFV